MSKDNQNDSNPVKLDSFEKQLTDLHQRTQLLDCSISEPPNRQSIEGHLPPAGNLSPPGQPSDPPLGPSKLEAQTQNQAKVSEEQIRGDLLDHFQKEDSKVRESSFKLGLKIIQNDSDAQHEQALGIFREQISFFINEKNLKIQTVLIEIVEILESKQLLEWKDNEKMFLFNLLDKFLSSNNRKLKAKTKHVLSRVIARDQAPFFEALRAIMAKANLKMTKALLFLMLSNEALTELERFAEMEEEMGGFCNKNYNHRMKEIKSGVLKMIQLSTAKFGEDFVSSISKISKKDKGTARLTSRDLPQNGFELRPQENQQGGQPAQIETRERSGQAGEGQNDQGGVQVLQGPENPEQLQQGVGGQGRVEKEVENQEQAAT